MANVFDSYEKLTISSMRSSFDPKSNRHLQTREQAILLYKLMRQIEADENLSFEDLLLQKNLASSPFAVHQAIFDLTNSVSEKMLSRHAVTRDQVLDAFNHYELHYDYNIMRFHKELRDSLTNRHFHLGKEFEDFAQKKINDLIQKGYLKRQLEGHLLFTYEDYCRLQVLAAMLSSLKIKSLNEEISKERRAHLPKKDNKNSLPINDYALHVIAQNEYANGFLTSGLQTIQKIMRISPV